MSPENLLILRHEQEMLVGRLINRLSESLYNLDVGLTALSKNKNDIMLERAELVAEMLREEITNLKLQQNK